MSEDPKLTPVTMPIDPDVRNRAEAELIRKGYRKHLGKLVTRLLEMWLDGGADVAILNPG